MYGNQMVPLFGYQHSLFQTSLPVGAHLSLIHQSADAVCKVDNEMKSAEATETVKLNFK